MAREIMNQLVPGRPRPVKLLGERSQTVRLVVQRMRGEKAVVSIIFTNVGGGKMSETRLGCATISLVDDEGVHLPVGDMLRRALEAAGL